MNVLIFDLYADFGHFRKIYSTSSPLTYSIIPPTAFYGMIGAIVGLEKEENTYLKYVNHHTVKFAVQLLHPVKKIRMGLNHINTKGNVWIPKHRREGARTQIRTEFLRFPKYRCYAHIKDSVLFDELIDYVTCGKNVYTVSMGLSECLAKIEFVSIREFEQKKDEEATEIATAVPERKLNSLEIEFGKEYFKERLPIRMDRERIVDLYDEVLFEANGRTVKASVDSYWTDHQGTQIVFLN
ncbi:type I-B CRISPR-associated protein Cas5b [Anoxybacillus sp. CHMUD]|jgi:CRISPR-associated protein Cas5h|uniref:type I-B CRISPR-associated protein Cas5b n=1 Tax=Anoxybacillus sp. CHMUD TaxID=2508870 RepID=UPI0014924F8F|nr:type I-B CRISPR-associated protein Cas5b [Anoxybacillus sp. CHMUD]NNU89258.1 type I-B CRISPR-associated protein Cas5 [Anoxybacillus sp. CHMUD]